MLANRSLFFEGPNGLLYPPNFADVIIRDTVTFEPASWRKWTNTGTLMLPTSYPDIACNKDLGIIESVSSNKKEFMEKVLEHWKGSKAELRGWRRYSIRIMIFSVFTPKGAKSDFDIFLSKIESSINKRGAFHSRKNKDIK